MNNIHPEVFRLYNDVFTKNVDKKIINGLLFWNKKIPKENQLILDRIIRQSSEIYESLIPLTELGITFDMWLVGGSVRDLLLGNGKLIKDLDIMINVYQAPMPKIPKASQFIKKSKFDFNKKQLQSIVLRKDSKTHFEHWNLLHSKSKDWKVKQKQRLLYDVAAFDVFACALGQKFDLYELYPPSLEQVNNFENSNQYLDLRLKGVIKIKKEGWDWPVDILMSNNNVDSFMQAFDFGICKTAIELVRSFDVRGQRFVFPQTAEDLMKRVRLTHHFLTDFKNKQHSMNVSEVMSLRQVKHSCEDHLPRLEKKYPWSVKINVDDYGDEFDGNGAKETNIQKQKEDYLNAFFLQRKLNRTLSTNELEKKKVKKI